ncbi:MAG: hypothetical protein CMK59_08925 [Proteobacteria bacterium]|nr:hypothetical protein [Pseudomonadota bacterium]
MTFPKIDKEQWEQRVCTELKGGKAQDLALTQLSGLMRSVFYERRPLESQTLPSAMSWKRVSPVVRASVGLRNTQLLADLKGGSDSVTLNAGRIWGASYLDRLLDGVHLSMIDLQLCEHTAPLSTAAILNSWYEEQRESSDPQWNDLSIHWGVDPFSQIWSVGSSQLLEYVFQKEYTEQLKQLPAKTLYRCSDRLIHNAGATDVEELATLLASCLELFRKQDSSQGLVQTMANKMQIELTVGRDLFSGIIKLRAARKLFKGLYHEVGVEGTPWFLARTSERMLSCLDPWVNMLRLTVSSFAAASSGVDGLIILPFDWPIHGSGRLCSELGHRVSRNLHPLLAEEASVGFFEDPAAGSYFFETQTDKLCEAAWRRLQEIEEAGGLAQIIKSDSWRAGLKNMWGDRCQQIASGKLPITGVSQFPLLEEHPLPKERCSLEEALSSDEEEQRRAQDFRQARGKLSFSGTSLVDFVHNGATLHDLPSFSEATVLSPLEQHRDSEDFEQMRETTTANPPKVFMINIGREAKWRGRADFAKDFLAAGGIRVVFSESVISSAEDNSLESFKEVLVEAQRYSCVGLCGLADDYKRFSSGLISALSDQGIELILLVGRSDVPEGVVQLHKGADQIAILNQIIRCTHKEVERC